MRAIGRFFHDEHAATSVEYAVLLGLIILAAILSIRVFGTEVGLLWQDVDSELTEAGVGS